MPKDYSVTAGRLIEELNGNNIKSVTHCMTRLRFVLEDENAVDDERIKKSPESWALRSRADSIR